MELVLRRKKQQKQWATSLFDLDFRWAFSLSES